jgi:acylaminoacyl-peptidase
VFEYVENVQTPVMLIHSEQDLRCPIEQAEQFFTALKFLKKEAVFVRFPNENHELSRSG